MLGWSRHKILAAARPVHKHLRKQKLRMLDTFVGKAAGTYSLLDVGGGLGITGEFTELYSSFKYVTVINLAIPKIQLVDGCQHVSWAVADGCMLPFPSRAFDWVFSNAVIEHVGSFEKQRAFAGEIRRVARTGYFVATPNKYFPIEPHTFLPFYQFLPPHAQRRFVRFSPGYLREYEEIRLLSAKIMRTLFPEAEVVSRGFPLFGNSLIAYYSSIPFERRADI